jgi:hypothetical protein
MLEIFRNQISLLKEKRSTLQRNLQDEDFMKEVETELFYKEFKRLSELALTYSFMVSTYSEQLSIEFYNLHESFRELATEHACCAA